MIRSPIVGSISTMLFSFNSKSQAFIESFPHLAGMAASLSCSCRVPSLLAVPETAAAGCAWTAVICAFVCNAQD